MVSLPFRSQMQVQFQPEAQVRTPWLWTSGGRGRGGASRCASHMSVFRFLPQNLGIRPCAWRVGQKC